MILRKKLSSTEVLEIIGAVVAETLPPELEGTVEATYDEDGGIEVFFIEKTIQTTEDNNTVIPAN